MIGLPNQESFFPEWITAHAANDLAYQRLNVGFHLSFLKGTDEHETPDSETHYWAMEFLRRERPAFLKIHLQQTGNAGWKCSADGAPAAWRHNIWGEGSPYRKAAAEADRYVGEFVAELERLGIREKTLLFVTADHGQRDEGSHPPFAEDGWAMPLVVTGPGIRAGARFDYAEQIDMVLTRCHAMGVKPPANADGRILAEAFEQAPAGVPERRQQILELNRLLREGDELFGRRRGQARLAAVENEYYGLERILDWHRFGAVERLMEHNRAVLEGLRRVD
jgi:arylsulfatase A-like enzyme